MSSGGPGSALYKSTDGGETWTDITHASGLPAGIDGKIGISISPVDPNRVFALIENENGGLFRSDDAGTTWTLVNNERRIPAARVLLHARLRRSRRTRTSSTSRTSARSARATAARRSRSSNSPRGDSHDIWIDPDDNNHVLHAADRGGDITFNAQADNPTWTRRGLSDRAVLSHRRDTRTCRITSAARSRTRARCACRRRPAFGGRGGGGGGRGGATGDVQPRRIGGRLHRARSARSGHLLLRHERERRRLSHEAQSPHRRSPRGESVSAHVLRRRVRGDQGTLAVDVPDHLLAGRQEDALHRLAAPLEDDERRRQLGPHQPRPHASRSEDDGSVGRSDHARHERPRGLRGDLLDRAVQAHDERRLDRIRRRHRQRHEGRRQDVEQRHAEGHARLRPREPDRRVGVRLGDARTSRSSDSCSTTRRRTSSARTTSARRGRRSSPAFAATTSCTPCARIRRARDCSTPRRSTASTSRTTTATTGSRST